MTTCRRKKNSRACSMQRVHSVTTDHLSTYSLLTAVSASRRSSAAFFSAAAATSCKLFAARTLRIADLITDGDEFRRHRQERLLHVGRILRGGFQERDLEPVSECLGRLVLH